jgi:hypothetical protein
MITLGQMPQRPRLSILPEINGVIKYIGSIDVDSNVLISELYNRASRWFVDHNKSGNYHLQINSKGTDFLKGKGSSSTDFNLRIYNENEPYNIKDSLLAHHHLDIFYNIVVYIKRGQYTYEVSSLRGNHITKEFDKTTKEIDIPLMNQFYKPKPYIQAALLNDTNQIIVEVIESFKKAMLKNS